MSALPEKVGKYKILQRLGGGGMGEVYLAEITGPGGFVREVAVKMIVEEFAKSERFVELFLREGRLLAGLHHRNVIQVFELDFHQGVPFLAMEYLKGISLSQLRHQHPAPLPWPLAAHLGEEIARALEAAHGLRNDEAPQGLVHGDLSPANVMISYDGAVKVLDFGLARPTEGEITGGKIPYLPPEVVSGFEGDHRMDIYALGVILHELLSGRRLFSGDDDVALIRQITTAKIGPPSERQPEVPKALDALVLRALAKDRTQRYQSAKELAEELGHLAQGRAGNNELARAMGALAPRAHAKPGDSAGLLTFPTLPQSVSNPEGEAGPRLGKRGPRVAVALALLGVVAAGLSWAALQRVPSTPEVVTEAPATPPAPAPAPKVEALPTPAAPEPAPAPKVEALPAPAAPAQSTRRPSRLSRTKPTPKATNRKPVPKADPKGTPEDGLPAGLLVSPFEK